MWIPTKDEAVHMYARFLTARHGRAAERYARQTAERLKDEGDQQGQTIWNEVADVIDSRKGEKMSHGRLETAV